MLGAMRRLFRWLGRMILLTAGITAAAVAGLVIYLSSGRYVTTENAYIKTELIIMTAEVSGRVVEVNVADNEQVQPGQALFQIDPQRFEIERERRRAQLYMARHQVDALKARYRTKLAELHAASEDAKFYSDELERTERLRDSGTISQTRLLEARRQSINATTRLDVLREQIAEVLAELGNDPDMLVDDHPDVMRATAEYQQADMDLHSATVRAPAHAIAANVRLQPGEYVEEGDPVMSLVAAHGFWVEANLKETDLTHLKVGQKATLEVDAYPDVVWEAEVASLSPATGAEYALIPPQNASGNWVKVVQRVPVRLRILPRDNAPALRAGMSVAVSIDTEHKRKVPAVLNTARAWILSDDSQ